MDGNKIRAARGLLGWTQKDIEIRTGILAQSVANIEKGKTGLSEANRRLIEQAFDLAGVEIIRGGVRFKRNLVTFLTGEDWYEKVLDDVYNTLLDQDGAEVLIDAVDFSKATPEIMNKVKKIREAGIAMRVTCEQGNTFIPGPLKEYRWIPSQYFKNSMSILYGEKVCISMAGKSGCMIFSEKDMAESQRNKFDLIWGFLDAPTESTASERI